MSPAGFTFRGEARAVVSGIALSIVLVSGAALLAVVLAAAWAAFV